MNYSSYLNGRIYCDLFSPEECLKIIKEAVISAVDSGKTGVHGKEDHDLRKTRVSFLEPEDPGNRWFCQRILAAGIKANNEYFKFELSGTSHFHLLEYFENGHYDWHVDIGVHGIEAARKLSMVTFLSDPESFTGGRLVWLNPDTTDGSEIRQKAGATVIFPAFQSHKVEPVTQGKRFALVGWLHGPTSFR